MPIGRTARRAVIVAVMSALPLTGCDGGAVGAVQPANRPASIRIVSGDNQEGREGALLREELGVRVTDERGLAVPGMAVTWRVISGGGDFWRLRWIPGSVTHTDGDGVARVSFRPTVRGTTVRIQAVPEHPRLAGSPATFTAHALNLVVIHFGPDDGCGLNNPSFFIGPDTVTVGVGVEWVYAERMLGEGCGGRVASTSAPPGGKHFDSGVLHPGAAFRFVPEVPGTWEYLDPVSGGAGTFTARAR